MHADIVTVQIQLGKIEEATTLYRDVGAPTLRKQPGVKACYLLRGSDPNKLVIFGLWETKANSEAWQNSEDRQQWGAKIAAVVAGPPAVESYEVSLQVV